MREEDPTREIDYTGLLLIGPLTGAVIAPLVWGFMNLMVVFIMIPPYSNLWPAVAAGFAGGMAFSLAFYLITLAFRSLRADLSTAGFVAGAIGAIVGYFDLALFLGDHAYYHKSGAVTGGLTGSVLVYWYGLRDTGDRRSA